MDFGIFSLMGYRDPSKSTQDVIEEVVEQTRVAEELGFGMSWFAEHHFSNYAICPSPLMMVAACAKVTSRIRLGTGVLVLPLYNPARLISEIAFTDALTDGRLVLGLGSGYQPYEFERFNADLPKSKQITEEFIDMIEKGLSEDFMSYKGEHFSMENTHITPRAVQRKLPIYLAGDSPYLQSLAARKGFGAMIAGRTGGSEAIVAQRDRCAANFAEAGVPADRMPLAVQRHCCVTHAPKVAERFADNTLYQIRLTTALRRRTEAMDGVMLNDNPFPEEPSVQDIHDNLMIGEPEQVAEKLVREIKGLSPDHICFYFQLGDFPHRDTLKSMELFMTKVVPMVESAIGPLSRVGAPVISAAAA